MDGSSKRYALLILALGFSSFIPLGAEILSYQYRPGASYRIVSEVDESVFVNGDFFQRSDFLNTVSVEILETDGEEALIRAGFRTSERAYGSEELYSWIHEEDSEFFRNTLGVYDMDSLTLYPSVRNIPVFSEEDLAPGDTWYAMAEEVQDLMTAFGIDVIMRIPFRVFYTYRGKVEYEGKEWDLIDMDYHIFHRPGLDEIMGNYYPLEITGSYHEQLYWDSSRGIPAFSEGEFTFAYRMTDGMEYEFRGVSRAEVIPGRDLSDEAASIQESLDSAGALDAIAEVVENGVRITLENIQFQPDSWVLMETEKEKLEIIAQVLLDYPQRAVLIEGHAARLGSEEYLIELSRRRAEAVGGYLIEYEVRDEDGIEIRGNGSSVPLASNETEEGRIRNRRVELTLLDN